MTPSAAPSAPPSPSVRIRSLDIVLLIVLAIAWGSAYIFIREGIVYGASPILFAAVRYALSAAAFAGLAAGRREAWPRRGAAAASAAIGGTLVIGAYGGFLYWGEQYTTGGYASVLSCTAPILTVAFAYTLLPSERLGPRSLIGLALGFAGTIVLVVPELAGGPIGTWEGPPFLIAAFVCATSGTVLLRRYGGGPQGQWQIGVQFAVAALLLGAVSLVVPGRPALPTTWAVLGSLVALVALSSVGGYLAYYTLHHRVGPVRANTVAYLLPLVGIALGSGFFAEPITGFEIVGFLIVLAGVTLILYESSRRPPAETR